MRQLFDRLRVAMLASLTLALVLHGCGGGVGTGGTGTFAQGPITGFGSIIVNGVRFDESAARIEDDEGGAQSAAALRLGMVVQIQAGPVSTLGAIATSTASLVRIERALVGTARDVNPAAGRFTVLGQTVAITADTLIDDRIVGGLAGLARIGVVEVYGSFDAAANRYVATRVGPAASGASNKVVGPASQIDTVARTLRIGSQVYSYAGLASLPGLSEGTPARLELRGDTDSSGRWVVSGQGSAGLTPAEATQFEVRGLVQAVASSTRFTVEGVAVDASSARVDGEVVTGARAKVSGTLRAGVLVATRVSVENDGPAGQDFEVKGMVTSVDAVAKTFRVRDTTISYARPDVQFSGGTAAQLAAGRKVEVEGRLAADRAMLEATRIEFDD